MASASSDSRASPKRNFSKSGSDGGRASHPRFTLPEPIMEVKWKTAGLWRKAVFQEAMFHFHACWRQGLKRKKPKHVRSQSISVYFSVLRRARDASKLENHPSGRKKTIARSGPQNLHASICVTSCGNTMSYQLLIHGAVPY